MKISGVYMILNRINGKKYIGSSEDVYIRWERGHLWLLRRGEHTQHIQSAYCKYGEESFVFMVIELVYDLTAKNEEPKEEPEATPEVVEEKTEA